MSEAKMMKYFIKKEDGFQPVEVAVNDDHLKISNGKSTRDVQITALENHYYSIVIDHRSYLVQAKPEKQDFLLNISHREAKVRVLDPRQKLEAEMFGAAEQDERSGDVKAPMPGMILRVDVKPGDEVQPGQPLLVMEAMKMENELRAHDSGKVAEILVKPQQAVEKNDLLIRLE